MIRNIRHIQIQKVNYHPRLFKAILTYEDTSLAKHQGYKSDDIEYLKLKELERIKKITKGIHTGINKSK